MRFAEENKYHEIISCVQFLSRVHFLEGIYTSEDLLQQVGKTVQTIGKTKWELQSNGRVTVTQTPPLGLITALNWSSFTDLFTLVSLGAHDRQCYHSCPRPQGNKWVHSHY